MSTAEVEAVLAWHEAGDAGRLAALSHPDVEVGGPRGTARGRQALADWVGQANVRLEPLCLFHHGRAVVVEVVPTRHDARTGTITGEAVVATVFVLDDRLVAGIFRHGGLQDALRSAGIEGSE
jgi:hypothetical protein